MDHREEFVLLAIQILANRLQLGQLGGLAGMLADGVRSGQNVNEHMEDVVKALRTGQGFDLDATINKIQENSRQFQGRDQTPLLETVNKERQKLGLDTVQELPEDKARRENQTLSGAKGVNVGNDPQRGNAAPAETESQRAALGNPQGTDASGAPVKPTTTQEAGKVTETVQAPSGAHTPAGPNANTGAKEAGKK